MRFSCFSACSFLRASDLLLHCSRYNSFTGSRLLVYRDATPFWCSKRRRSRSFVMPVYKVLSLHRTMYKNHPFPATLVTTRFYPKNTTNSKMIIDSVLKRV